MFETLKFKSKKNYYSKLISKYKNNLKNTWSVIKEVIGKTKIRSSTLPRRHVLNGIETFDKTTIANGFNDYFSSIGEKLAKNISSDNTFESYLSRNNINFPEKELTDDELKSAFDQLKPNKSSGYDEIHPTVVKQAYNLIKTPLKYIFKLSINTGDFPDKLKIARVTPIFKSGEETFLNNYRPISVLPCLSKILERIMYNRLYTFLNENNLLYEKQFGFQAAHSTDHAIVELANQIYSKFNENKFTLGVFIDLSKAFDTVDHDILLTKLKFYGIHNMNHKWFRSYLTSRKQFIECDKTKTKTNIITCGVPQGSILGPLLFLIYVNDLNKSSNILNPIMFADDTNLFYSHNDIKTLFKTVNNELKNIHEWFKANKLSLNADKTKYVFFHKTRISDYLPLQLPTLYIDAYKIKRVYFTKFLGVMLDENLTWKKHIELIESKMSKNIGILYKAKFLLNKTCLKNIYFSFIQSYLIYANIAWASTNQTKLKKIYSKQKHASRIIFQEGRYTHARPLMKTLNALNIYQINIFQTLVFMFKLKNNMAPKVFQNQFKSIQHKYPTKYSLQNFKQPKTISKLTKYSITSRGPELWNNFINNETKLITNISRFKKTIKKQILNFENEIIHF